MQQALGGALGGGQGALPRPRAQRQEAQLARKGRHRRLGRRGGARDRRPAAGRQRGGGGGRGQAAPGAGRGRRLGVGARARARSGGTAVVLVLWL